MLTDYLIRCLRKVSFHILKILLYPANSRRTEILRVVQITINTKLFPQSRVQECTEQGNIPLVWVDPNLIRYETRTLLRGVLPKSFATCKGDWDRHRTKFDDRYKIVSLKNHFRNGLGWEHTLYYKRINLWLTLGGKWRGCTNSEELLKYLKRYDDLYNNIENNGYKTQSELDSTLDDPKHYEIGVSVGRNGELYWHDRGQHRLCIAQLLDVDQVPVRILATHANWEHADSIGELQSIDS